MADYRCPSDITENFRNERLARKIGRGQHIAWIKKLVPRLRRGDRVEVFDADGNSTWWVYARDN